MATHLEDPDFPTRLTSSGGRFVLSGRLKLGKLPEPESTLDFFRPTIRKGSVRSPVRVLVGISFIILCDLPK